MTRPIFEIVTTSAGAVSIRNNVVNEIMHNPVGPWAEANALYIEQSKLDQRLLLPITRPLVVFDVGLGAAANALAAMHSVKRIVATGAVPRPLHIVSFERDLDLLEFALENAAAFDHFNGFEDSIRSLLDHGYWKDEHIVWELRHGDFLTLIETEPHSPDVIFYDPYSPSVNVDMWTQAAFQKLRNKCRDDQENGAILYTYSQATPIRVAMLTGGFYVGHGRPTGLKEETTQAATRLEELDAPLAAKWFKRWSTSHTPYPPACAVEQRDSVLDHVRGHMQFTFSQISAQ